MKLAAPFIVDDLVELSAFLQGRRQYRGLTQLQVARKVGTVQSAVSDWEKGQDLRVLSLVKLAGIYGYQVALVGGPSCDTCFDDPPSGFQCMNCKRMGGLRDRAADRG